MNVQVRVVSPTIKFRKLSVGECFYSPNDCYCTVFMKIKLYNKEPYYTYAVNLTDGKAYYRPPDEPVCRIKTKLVNE